MATVWMRHPDLPADQLIEVDERLVPGHRAAGWVVTEAPPKPARASEDDLAVPVEEKKEPAPEKTARRRAPKEGEEK